MPPQTYERDKNGIRLDLTGGINTMLPPDLIQQGYPYLQNIRRNLAGRAIARPPLGPNVIPGGVIGAPVASLVLMNDPYMGAPGYVYIAGSTNGILWVNAIPKVTGLSGLPLSFLTYRPNTSPQPWCYVADPAMAVSIPNYPAEIYGNPLAGMVKVRSDGTIFKTGIAEPQVAPTVTLTGGPGPNWVIYRYVYRSSITGAVSNPSPESPAQTQAQTTVSGSMVASDSRVQHNASQYETVSGQTYLRTSGSVNPGTLTDYIIPLNFGLNIPLTVNINGIQVTLDWYGQNAGTGILANVALFYQGSQIGLAKSPGVLNVAPTGSPQTVTQGGNSDNWGAVITPQIANDSTFGFGVQIETAESGGTDRSFIISFTIQVFYTNQNSTVSATPSIDPQVDKIDFYRDDPGLNNFTYVGTIPNGTSGFSDQLTSLSVANNPILEFDNYEPFPSIDLPHSGSVSVGANGIITNTGGDPFNVRWLPGNIILIGSPSSPDQVAWTLYARPSSTTQLQVYQSIIDPTTGLPTFSFPPQGPGQTYEISAATLAAEPSPAIWGPTPDNQGSFYFGLDPLNPGDLLWSKGNNFDSAPDTNRMFVTSPSEMLMNGTITSELSTVFSAERFWLIYPNFANAVATVTGTQGQPWTLIQAHATRGLYMRYAIAALGSMVAYRAKDCIAMTMGGDPEQSLTDDSIYNLFPHSGMEPTPVTIAGNTIYPPDDTKPYAQTLTLTPSYLFYNYQDTTGTQRTLVYDLVAKGWSVDVYTPRVNTHLWATSGLVQATAASPTTGSPQQLLVGCVDGTVRQMGGGGEAGTAIIATRSENGGDARALKRIGDVFFRGEIQSGNPVSLQFWQSLFTVPLTGFSPASLSGAGAVAYYTVDFVSGFGYDVQDVGAILLWPLGSNNVIDLWQPDWIQLPEIIQDRPSDWSECGVIGNKLIRGMIIEMDTFNTAKAIQVQRSDSETLIAPNQASITANGQTLVPFTFDPPFTAHMMRIISTDGVAWRMWGEDASWIVDPWPDYTPLYSAWTNLGTDGAKYLRSLLIPMDTNGAPASFRVQTSDGPAVTFSATTPTAVKTPVAFAFVPPLVVHDVQLQCESNAALWTSEVQWIFDQYPEIIPAYTPIMEISSSANKYVRGMNLTGDTGNLPITFQVLFDGGQIGPAFTATFNGKQTVDIPFDPPFIAHDLQLVPQQNARIFLQESQWILDPWSPYITIYSPWMNLGRQEPKYIRSMTLPLDTKGVAAVFRVISSDGASVTFSATTPAGVKSPVGFAFVPPIVAHEVQIIMESNAAMWAEEAQWEADPYPEIIPAYTPIMEVTSAANKYVRGLTITGDTANIPVTFQVLYDGGRIGPVFTATFNGKQSVDIPFDPPFIAHDLQLVPQANARIFLDTSQWILDPWAPYITLYSPWMNLGSQGSKYIRSLTLPLDTNGALANFRVISSEGANVSFSATTTPVIKSPVAFAFTPPVVAHEVQIIMESNAAMWAEEAAWEFDAYPELIPAYTPIMELSSPDNKFMQGLKLIGDTANNFVGDTNGQPVSFQVKYDGGQLGPVLGPVVFNGKQTQVFSFNPPFYAHDLQLVPLQPCRLWLPGMGGDDSLGESSWVFQPAPDSATTWTTEFSSLGLYGWCFVYQINLAYVSSTPVTLAVTTDQGSFTLTYPPSTGGANVPSKILLKCPRNKWKVISFSATSTSAFSLWQDLTEVWIRSWGETSEFHKINPFGGPSSPAAPI